ncbi:MAG: hypothetical protein J6Q68_05110 [Clostridia bacterium]|nr:hypothetical protein [Clostridia bacterium]
MPNYVRYEDFGAIGDGIHDDFDAIKAAHEYANANGLDVICNSNGTYRIGNTSIDETEAKPAIKIQTNVDWSNAKFIIDDSDITEDMPAKKNALFRICRDGEDIIFTEENDTPNGAIKRINAEGGFKANISRLNLGIGYSAMLLVTNDEKKVYIRYGVNSNSGGAQREIVSVDSDGFVDPNTAFLLDYGKVTSITVMRTDDKPITVSGGRFTHIANRVNHNEYYHRNISISRSNVTVRGVTYSIEGEGEVGAPYSGFIGINKANNVLIEDCVLQAHKYYYFPKKNGVLVPKGTYSINLGNSNNVTFKGCTQSNFFDDEGKNPRKGIWGIMGSNFCKNLVYDSCVLSRFDAHAGVYNAKILNSKISAFRIIGGGEIKIQNTHVYSNTLIGLREDYGSTWNGDLILENVTLHNTKAPTLIYGQWYNHDFGYQTYLPQRIVFDNLQITEGEDFFLYGEKLVEQSQSALREEIDGAQNVNKTAPTKELIIKNNIQGLEYKLPETEFFSKTKLINK